MIYVTVLQENFFLLPWPNLGSFSRPFVIQRISKGNCRSNSTEHSPSWEANKS